MGELTCLSKVLQRHPTVYEDDRQDLAAVSSRGKGERTSYRGVDVRWGH